MYTLPHSQGILYMPGVLNSGGILGWWHVAGYFLVWYGDAFDIVFGQHPKRRLLELRRLGITQEKTYYIKNTAKA
jgi:hypothetical protein